MIEGTDQTLDLPTIKNMLGEMELYIFRPHKFSTQSFIKIMETKTVEDRSSPPPGGWPTLPS